jgi:hypothetical protein
MNSRTAPNAEKAVLRDLTKRYAEIAADPIQEERRNLWQAHLSLRTERIPIQVSVGWHNTWVKDYFTPQLACTSIELRQLEIFLRLKIFHHAVGDDFIQEPWITIPALFAVPYGIYGEGYGVKRKVTGTHDNGGSWKAEAPIREWSDLSLLSAPGHQVDEDASAEKFDRFRELLGDIIEIDEGWCSGFHGFSSDISTTVAGLRGLEQVMMDMASEPDELHKLLTFMRDSVLSEHEQAESADHFRLTTQTNQSQTYADDLERPQANAGPRKRNELWGFCAAQEMTLISPQHHEEFIFNYQKPIYEHFGLVHYGCCEDLTRKIDMVKKLPNLRSIGVTPVADVRKCAEQIGTDIAISYRPNPTDMVCGNWDESRIRRIITRDLEYCRGQHVHVSLKDIETVRGDETRLRRWTDIVRSITEGIPAV